MKSLDPRTKTSPGKVYLVGAGPGDPGLLTIRGRALLARAEVVVYDHLASARLLDLAPRDAEDLRGKVRRALHDDSGPHS